MEFSNTTKNFEDGFGMCERSVTHRRRNLSSGRAALSKQRVMTHVDPALPVHKPHQLATDESMVEAKASLPPPLRNPSMYPDAEVMKERLATYAPGGELPTSLTFTVGRDALKPSVPQLQDITTNQWFYKTLPDTARQQNPQYHQPWPPTYHRTCLLGMDGDPSQQMQPGTEPLPQPRRGECVRCPREGGNPYGVSVFVDEYAKWGGKLAGMPLAETVSRARTQYF